MKILIAAVAILLGAVAIALADPTTNSPSVTVAWDVHQDQSVVGYRVYYGVSSRTYTNNVQVLNRTNNSATVSNLVRSTTYYFAATAFTDQGLESDYSNEVPFTTTPIPTAPINTRVTIKDP